LSTSLNKIDLLKSYLDALSYKYIEGNKKFCWCPGTDCRFCVKIKDLYQTSVVCKCGVEFCFKCKTEKHEPCPCLIS